MFLGNSAPWVVCIPTPSWACSFTCKMGQAKVTWACALCEESDYKSWGFVAGILTPEEMGKFRQQAEARTFVLVCVDGGVAAGSLQMAPFAVPIDLDQMHCMQCLNFKTLAERLLITCVTMRVKIKGKKS